MEANSFSLLGKTALSARGALEAAAARPAGDVRRMADVGAAALFEEALLGALRAHLAELRAVAR